MAWQSSFDKRSWQGLSPQPGRQNDRVMNAGVGFQLLPLLRDISAKCGSRTPKNDSISIAYEFRTKSGKSGGLETNGRRERISGHCRGVEVWRFVREGRGYWGFVP